MPIQKINNTSMLKQVLDPGEYNARLMGYDASTSYGKQSFYLTIDVDYGNTDPLRLRHYVNAKWMPNLLIANICGWIAQDNYLINLKAEDLEHMADAHKAFKDGIPVNVVLGISKFNGRNDILQVIGNRIIELVDTAKELSPFVEEDKPHKVTLQPLGFEAGSDEVPF